MAELGTEVGKESFGRASSHSREEMVGDVVDGETVECQLPTVMESSKTQREALQIWVTGESEKLVTLVKKFHLRKEESLEKN